MRDYIAACPLMSEFESKHRHIDWTDEKNENYGIFPDSDEEIDRYIDGTELRRYVCQITIRKFSVDDAERLRNNEFLERLQIWFAKQKEKGNMPKLPEGCETDEIRSANAMLSDINITGNRGVYTIQIIMDYLRDEL